MNVKISVLKMFIAVVEAGNILDASEKVNRSASAVSTALKLLEEDIGGTLFETDRKNQLTALGNFLYETAQTQVGGYEKALSNVQAFAKGHLGKVQMASVPSVATYLLPATLNKFIQNYPTVEIELRDMDSSTIAGWVERGKIDFGLGGQPSNNKVNFDPIFEDELVLVYPLSLPIVQKTEPIEISQLQSFTWISNGIISNSKDDALQSFHQGSHLNVHNTASLLALVTAGVGVTILPKLTVPPHLVGLGTCELKLKNNHRKVGLITNPTNALSPVSKILYDFLKAEIVRKD